MDKLPFRQVHLDFHTSECMPDVAFFESYDDMIEKAGLYAGCGMRVFGRRFS